MRGGGEEEEEEVVVVSVRSWVVGRSAGLHAVSWNIFQGDHLFRHFRLRTRRGLQDFKFDLESQDERSSLSHASSVKNSPESEANPKHWAIVSEGFPPGVTVDELKRFGRRRQPSHLRPQDNLRLEEGSLRLYKSEYKRRYLAYSLPKVVLTREEERALEKEEPRGFYLVRAVRPQNNLFVVKDQPMESETEKNAKYVAFGHCEKRKLLRRSTALKPEGEVARETEVRKEYVDHKNPEKVGLIRNLPSLRLEGEYEPPTTEQREKFIGYLLSRRPVLEKKKTSLRMEGDFDFATEKTRSFVPHEFQERPLLRKRSTSLKLEGEVEFSPEYRMSFVDFPRSRPVAYKPIEKIRQEGELENLTETKTQFVNYEKFEIPGSAKPENNLHVEGEMEINPEYRINFVDFPRERPIIRKPFNQLKPEGNLEVLRESSGRRSGELSGELSGVGELGEGVQRPGGDVSLEKELSYLSENGRKLEGDEIPGKVESGEGEGKGGLGVEAGSGGSAKLERKLMFFPEFGKRFTEKEEGGKGKFEREVKSNASSPRKKVEMDRFRSCSEDKKKSSRGSLEGKSSVKRLREAASEKIEREIVREKGEKSEEGGGRGGRTRRGGKGREGHPQNLRFSEVSPKGRLPSLKEFPAFKVLDVKGQMGCQSLRRDAVESEKSTSDEENSTYRLEVFNPGNRSPGFYRNDRRIFPTPGVDPFKLEEAETRAKQRAESYVKVVKSPEIPNSLLENGGERETEGRWRMSEKLRPLSVEENLKERSFVVLEKKGREGLELPRTPKGFDKQDKENWVLGACDSSLP